VSKLVGHEIARIAGGDSRTPHATEERVAIR
jgi:hypothetical protein